MTGPVFIVSYSELSQFSVKRDELNIDAVDQRILPVRESFESKIDRHGKARSELKATVHFISLYNGNSR